MATVVTVSASYGAGGSEIAPRLAERLGVPFVDRAVPVAVANDVGVPADDAEALAQSAPSGWWRALARMSTLSNGWALPCADDPPADELDLVERTQQHLRELADTSGCVVLGHAGAALFADRADALHVRLDGAPAGRIASAMRQHGTDHDTAAAAQAQNDKVRAGYVQRYYGIDSAHPGLYHLVLDTVRLSWADAEQLVLTAAQSARSR